MRVPRQKPKDDFPDWLTEEAILAARAKRILKARGVALPSDELPPLTLKEFVHEFWPVLEADMPLAWGWALDAMCLHLEAVSRREIRKLIINVPPGTMKSMLTNVFFPAWMWGEVDASERFLAVAYTESLSLRDSTIMRRLVRSAEYIERYGAKVALMRDNNAKGEYDNASKGKRVIKPIESATGVRGNVILIDDPNNAAKIHSRAHRRDINNAYSQSISRRGADPKKLVQIIIMQRLHEEDLTGFVTQKDGHGWEVLRLPERYEPEYHTKTSIWEDPRTERGQLLFPEFRDEADVREAEKTLGSYGTAAQLQQRPSPVGGGIVKEHWWRFHAPAELLPLLPKIHVLVADEETGDVTEVECPVVATPTQFRRELTSWDMTFKDSKDSDFVVGQAWGDTGANAFLLDQVRGRLDFVKTKRTVQTFTAKWPHIREHVVEDKANGPAIISELRTAIQGLIAWEPEGSKESRVYAESAVIEAGNVYLPHPHWQPWVASEYLPEWRLFPNGSNDDQIDSTTQALQRLRTSGNSAAIAELEELNVI